MGETKKTTMGILKKIKIKMGGDTKKHIKKTKQTHI